MKQKETKKREKEKKYLKRLSLTSNENAFKYCSTNAHFF